MAAAFFTPPTLHAAAIAPTVPTPATCRNERREIGDRASGGVTADGDWRREKAYQPSPYGSG
jgi:hypothetical protein